MTMQHNDHPQDERLAALAGGDPEATSDRALVEHVDACDRCRPQLDELAALTDALAELPDLVPPRRLQLVPPAAPEPARSGWLGWLRTLTGPAMVVGGGLVLVGALGLGGSALQSAAGGAIFQNVGSDLNGGEQYESSPRAEGQEPAAAASPKAPTTGDTGGNADGGPYPKNETDTPAPWLTLLVLGAALLLPALVLRFSISPRAG